MIMAKEMPDIADVQLYGDNKNALTEVGAFFMFRNRAVYCCECGWGAGHGRRGGKSVEWH